MVCVIMDNLDHLLSLNLQATTPVLSYFCIPVIEVLIQTLDCAQNLNYTVLVQFLTE